jgi:hypothetical protein
VSRCPAHAAAKKRAYNEARPAALVKFYGSVAWKRFRAHVKAVRPICECVDPKCKHRRWGTTCTQPTTVPDHVIEPMRDWSRALDPTNVQALCASCHSSKTARTQSWHRG